MLRKIFRLPFHHFAMLKSAKQRYTCWILSAACILLVFIFQNAFLSRTKDRSSFSVPPSSCPAIPPKPDTYIPPTREGFAWREVPTRYPVSSLMQLPTSEPSPMPRIQHRFSRSSPVLTENQEQRREAVK